MATLKMKVNGKRKTINMKSLKVTEVGIFQAVKDAYNLYAPAVQVDVEIENYRTPEEERIVINGGVVTVFDAELNEIGNGVVNF